MLNARNFIFVESLFPQTSRLSFVTDLTSEKTYCKAFDFYDTLKKIYKFKVDEVKDIKVKIDMGSSLVLDLEKRVAFNFDEIDKVILQRRVIREGTKNKEDTFSSLNRYVEDLVNKNLFKR